MDYNVIIYKYTKLYIIAWEYVKAVLFPSLVN